MPELSSEGQRMSIPGLEGWLESAQGRYVLGWESSRVDAAVADIFGFNALQLGMPCHDFLRANRIPLRQKAGDAGPVDALCELTALPFAAHSTDLVVLPHVLEFSQDAHQILREIERILIPEGQLIVLGFNPVSLWGLRNRLDRSGSFPWHGAYISLPRLKDWLKLLGFEVDRGIAGCRVPPCERQAWLRRWRFMETADEHWWGFPGGVYMLRAIKRTHAMRLITPAWRKNAVAGKALRPIAQKENHGH
ncbi:class I SAM-dependent methyltransferase [Dechloromonas sp. H13]|uniref:class I SAM-dependent methyltransferase n=1 Tax=Dechloromonas sp. H13 TaxID=2570193 RepID=UPI0034CF11E0